MMANDASAHNHHEIHEHIPQDFDGPVEHPGVSTELDNEEDQESNSTGRPLTASTDTIQNIPPEQPLPRSKSSSSSTRSRTPQIVPRSERRGLLARLAIIPEVTRPHDYKNSTKWIITLIIALAAVVAPMGSAIFYRTSLIILDMARH